MRKNEFSILFTAKKSFPIFMVFLFIAFSIPLRILGAGFLTTPGFSEINEHEDTLSAVFPMRDIPTDGDLPPYKRLLEQVQYDLYITPKDVNNIIWVFKERDLKQAGKKLHSVLNYLGKDQEDNPAFKLFRLSLLSMLALCTKRQKAVIVENLENASWPLGLRIFIAVPGALNGAQSARYRIKPTWIVIDGNYAHQLLGILSFLKVKQEKTKWQQCGFGNGGISAQIEFEMAIGYLFGERWLIHECGHKDRYAKNYQKREEKRLMKEVEVPFYRDMNLKMSRLIAALFLFLEKTGKSEIKKSITAKNRVHAWHDAIISDSDSPLSDFVESVYPETSMLNKYVLAMKDNVRACATSK